MTENLTHSLDSISSSHSPHRPSKISKTTDDLSDDEQQQQQQQPESMSQRPGIQRYLLAIEYIGTRFSGSQQQPNCRTVVGVLEEAFHKFIGQPVSMFCSSRTDAGVHALSNVCHVDVERISKRKPGEVLEPHEPAVVKRAVNHFLQKNEGDVMVIDVRSVPANFHARYKAQERTYFYRLLSGAEPLSTFEKDRAWHVPEELNLRAMQEACKVLVGHHDFSSFRAAGCQVVPNLLIVGKCMLAALLLFLLVMLFYELICFYISKRILAAFLLTLYHSILNLACLAYSVVLLPVCWTFSKYAFFKGKDYCNVLKLRYLQAKSPIRTLDELNVSEVVSTPCLPSIMERKQNNLGEGPHAGTNKSETDPPPSFNGGADLGFGLRKKHRCFVVTARARAFLYHQVRLLVGVLKAVGTGDLKVPDVERILNAKTVTAASPMAPACGLYLGHVKYDLP